MTGWNPSTASTWSTDGRAGACPKARRMATPMATALLGLNTIALMSGGLHYDNILQETPHLVGGTKIAAAAIGWSATSSVIMPAIEAAARWPGRKTTGALAATGLSAALGASLTAVAANVEASFTPEAVITELNHHMADYGTSKEISSEIDRLQHMYSCCGSEGPDTYDKSKEHITGEVPTSCCTDHRDDCDRLDTDQLNQEGCARPLSEDITAALHVLTGLLIAQAGALVVATLVAAVVGLGRCSPAED